MTAISALLGLICFFAFWGLVALAVVVAYKTLWRKL
jgi:hypothetical protein